MVSELMLIPTLPVSIRNVYLHRQDKSKGSTSSASTLSYGEKLKQISGRGTYQNVDRGMVSSQFAIDLRNMKGRPPIRK